MSAISSRAHIGGARLSAPPRPSVTLNCGYGRGYSVLEVIDAVKRASGRNFPVRHADRRPGDPAAIVAAAERIRMVLGWTPEWNNLDTIVAHALAWERKLVDERSEPHRKSIPA